MKLQITSEQNRWCNCGREGSCTSGTEALQWRLPSPWHCDSRKPDGSQEPHRSRHYKYDLASVTFPELLQSLSAAQRSRWVHGGKILDALSCAMETKAEVSLWLRQRGIERLHEPWVLHIPFDPTRLVLWSRKIRGQSFLEIQRWDSNAEALLSVLRLESWQSSEGHCPRCLICFLCVCLFICSLFLRNQWDRDFPISIQNLRQ